MTRSSTTIITRAVVTGHSRGLGAAIAQELLAAGIAVLGISRGDNQDLASRFGGSLEQIRLDLADPEALASWLEGGSLGQFLDGTQTALLVNNAGVLTPIGPLQSQDARAAVGAAIVNVGAALALSAAMVAATTHSGERRILHVSSGAGRNAYAGWSVYCATKAALDHHARAVALDGTPRLRIASVAPGVIDTEMQAEIRRSSDEAFPDRARFVAMKHEGRLRTPEDAAAAVVEFLLSEEFGQEPVADLRYTRNNR